MRTPLGVLALAYWPSASPARCVLKDTVAIQMGIDRKTSP